MDLDVILSWRGYDMESRSALLALCEDDTPVTGAFPPSQTANGAELRFVSLMLAWVYPGTYKTQELPCGIRVAGNP